ncbi:FAD-dependent oxidoreductase [Paenibacillus dokdonensis]|uniref:FAD-dependent oxidoreductase n=1 Tax=Paenibacillus dokdonensis TaxID=2567944 RepID=A0ABU6GG01_9BACL|nr:FAD-dependent oxidoreductase [Paenibacillus dokdonensis]MEC0238650.1 FAD-dependent oxidoreductase [Paenibacillus dokdonensis]
MILNSGKLAWPHTLNPVPEYPALDQDLDCDVLVVGGGMSGAILSYELTNRKLNTVMIDKRSIGGGSSSANTGLLQFSNDKTLTSIMNTFGEEIGVAFYKLCERAMQKLIDTGSRLYTDPHLIPRSSFYYASHEDDVAMLQEEYENFRKYGFHVDYWDQAKIEQYMPFSKPAALYTHGDAEVNPFRMVHALVEAAARHGAHVFEHTEAIHFDYDENSVTCHTQTHKIRAKKVIYTMGYETQEIKKDRNAVLKVSYAVLTNPVEDLSDWHERCMIWETARPYLYMRTTPDNRIVVGGLDEHPPAPAERDGRALHKSEALLDEVRTLFPRYKELKADYAWASIFGSTHDGLPMIGTHPDYPNSYFIEAYGGNGTVYCMIAADILSDVLTGKDRPELEMFSLQRSSKPSPHKPLTLI